MGACGPAQKSKVYVSENSDGSHISSSWYSCIQKALDRSTEARGGQAGCPSQRSSFRSEVSTDQTSGWTCCIANSQHRDATETIRDAPAPHQQAAVFSA